MLRRRPERICLDWPPSGEDERTSHLRQSAHHERGGEHRTRDDGHSSHSRSLDHPSGKAKRGTLSERR